MQDLKKSKRKMNNKQMSNMKNKNPMPIVEEEIEIEDLDRGWNKSKGNMASQNDTCGCNNSNSNDESHNNGCNCSKTAPTSTAPTTFSCVCTPQATEHEKCEPCSVESEECVKNNCGEECCCPINTTLSTKNTTPLAIEAQRVFDAIQFQVFTDATAPNGEPLFFDLEVAEVMGRVPTTGLANLKINEVCMNFSSIEVDPGNVAVEDFIVQEIEDDNTCDTVFEFAVCPDRSATCCAQCKGQNLSYKQKGLTVIVNDLVLEIRGNCGCTNVVAFAFPAIRRNGGQLCRVDSVEFNYNTLSARICAPSSGKSFTLRQDYDFNLTVDCISKAFITAHDCTRTDCDCDCKFSIEIPSGIDLIGCLQEEVSVLVNQQIVVMGATGAVTPRTVDTFANVCSFPGCPGSANE